MPCSEDGTEEAKKPADDSYGIPFEEDFDEESGPERIGPAPDGPGGNSGV